MVLFTDENFLIKFFVSVSNFPNKINLTQIDRPWQFHKFTISIKEKMFHKMVRER